MVCIENLNIPWHVLHLQRIGFFKAHEYIRNIWICEIFRSHFIANKQAKVPVFIAPLYSNRNVLSTRIITLYRVSPQPTFALFAHPPEMNSMFCAIQMWIFFALLFGFCQPIKENSYWMKLMRKLRILNLKSLRDEKQLARKKCFTQIADDSFGKRYNFSW